MQKERGIGRRICHLHCPSRRAAAFPRRSAAALAMGKGLQRPTTPDAAAMHALQSHPEYMENASTAKPWRSFLTDMAGRDGMISDISEGGRFGLI
jgi:hypothetical protein